MGLYLKVLKNYATFEGRARRTEYWMFSLINFGISLITSFFVYMSQDSTGLAGFFSIISTLYGIAILIPGLAVTVRRLHDIGKSGWWWFIGLVPLIGWAWMLLLLFTDSQPGDNQYGPNPKGVPVGGKKREPGSGTKRSFTLWVKDENPSEHYMLALLFRTKNEHPEMMSDEIKDMINNKIPHDLQYKITRNHSEGRTYVEFIFTRR